MSVAVDYLQLVPTSPAKTFVSSVVTPNTEFNPSDDKLIFISSPYTDGNPLIRQLRYQQVMAYCAHLFNQGLSVYSPIVYGHEMAKAHTMRTDWLFWWNFNKLMLSRSDSMHVYMLDGWNKSVGVSREISYAAKNDIPTEFITPIKPILH